MQRPLIRQNAVGDHGIIGNMHTAALIGVDATIEWLCYPHFDSPSVFASILDRERGGAFVLQPKERERTRHTQFYWSETNVLTTRFWSRHATVDVTDFMPVEPAKTAREKHSVVRHVTCLRGDSDFLLWCEPRFDYGREAARASPVPAGVHLEGAQASLEIASEVPLQAQEGAAGAEFRLRRGETATFMLAAAPEHARAEPLGDEAARRAMEETAHFWREWMKSCTYEGRWRESVQRSALVLKVLSFAPTGALVAAPTCSLPTDIGGERNWDYRYTWIRDASFMVYALMHLGFRREAHAFMDWVSERCAEGPLLRPLYRIDGSTVDTEEELEHLSGFMGSRPVRIGNGAGHQLQLDVYGPLLDSIYMFNKHGTPISRELWFRVRRVVDWLCENWELPDQGVWEVRSEARQFTFSKVAMWVALDRACRLATWRGFPADLPRWRSVRDAIADWVYDNAWNERVGAFVQAPDGDELDATALLMSLWFFASPLDQQLSRSVAAVHERLGPDGLLRRYPGHVKDGLRGQDGAFAACSFWLVDAYTREGKLLRARRLLEMLLAQANHLGLYAEQFTEDGALLGNFPQAFTHLAMISATTNLDRALNQEGGHWHWGPATAWRAHDQPPMLDDR